MGTDLQQSLACFTPASLSQPRGGPRDPCGMCRGQAAAVKQQPPQVVGGGAGRENWVGILYEGQ